VDKINLMVIRKLSKMKLRTVGISFVVAMAAAMFISGLYSAEIFDHSTDVMLQDSMMPDIFVEFAQPVNESELEPVLERQQIKAYDMRLKVMAFYTYKGEVFPAFVIGMRDPGRQDINVMTKASGSLFERPGEGVVISSMEDYGADAGEIGNFIIGGKEVNITISGVVKNAEYALAGYMAETSVPIPGNVVALYMDLEELQGIMNVTGINDLVIIKENGADSDAIIGSLSSFPVKGTTLQKDHFTVIFMQMGVDKMKYMMPMFSVIFMIVGFISIMMTAYRLVLNDSRYIGVLMSLGYQRKKIIRAYLLLGVVLGSIGLIFGILLSFLFSYGIANVTMEMIGSIDIAFPISLLPFVLGFLFVMISVLLSVAIPVVLITGTSVREALDYKPRSKITTARFGPSFLSRTNLMGLRNVTRNPTRLGITVLVVGMTIGMSGSWLIMIDSAWGYVEDSIDSDKWDMRADFFGGVSVEELDQIEIYLENETEFIIPYTGISGSVDHGSHSTGATFLGCGEIEKARDFNVMKGSVDLDKAVITNKVADETGAGVGDMITLSVGPIVADIEVSAIVNDIVQQAVYTNEDNLDAFFSPENCTGIYIKLKNPAMTEEYAGALRLHPSVIKVSVKDQIAESFDELLSTANGIFYTFFVISASITFVVSASAVIISTMERDVEFATLSTLGITKWKVAKSILLEMGVLGILSGIIGVPLAYLFAKIFALVMAKILFTYPVIFIMGATIITLVSGIAVVLFSSVVPIRYQRKVDTEKTLRERTAG